MACTLAIADSVQTASPIEHIISKSTMQLHVQTTVPKWKDYTAYTRHKRTTLIRPQRHPDTVRPHADCPQHSRKLPASLSASQSAEVTDHGSLCVLSLCWCALPTALETAPCDFAGGNADGTGDGALCVRTLSVRTANGAGNGALCVRGGDCRRHRRRCPVRPDSVWVRTADGAGNGAPCVRGGDCRRHGPRCFVRRDFVLVGTALVGVSFRFPPAPRCSPLALLGPTFHMVPPQCFPWPVHHR